MQKILSWNVNGLRAVIKTGFLDWLQVYQPDIICLQETRVLPEDLTPEQLRPPGYQSLWNPAAKKGYSGTAAYVKALPLSTGSLGLDHFDGEGRLQVLEYPEYTLLNGYWPNSQDKRKRLDYKLEFVDAVTRFANTLVREGKNVILCGDLNIAHEEIDIARPKQNMQSAGFYIEEREAMTKFLGEGYVDTFRHFVKDGGHYTWWSYFYNARAKNNGWRIDYHCVNQAFMPRVKRAWIECDIKGSDHCPVAIEIDCEAATSAASTAAVIVPQPLPQTELAL